jgi:3-hydroxyacyl-[acyl-carrier-protein] dehydratase
MTGVAEITRIIPHRYPVLLVDRVADVVPGVSLTGYKAVTAVEPCYREASDFAYPFGLLLESWAQSAVVLVQWEKPNPSVLTGKAVLISSIKDVALLGAVHPGDVVTHRVRVVRALDDAAIVAGESFVGDRQVLRVGQFMVALRDVDVLGGSRVG